MFSPAAALAIAAVGVAYARGIRRLGARGRRWPATRTLPFLAGLLVLAAATQGPVAANEERFAVHAVQHLLLAMVAPPLLALGAPVTLALQAAGRYNQRRLLRVLHTPVVDALTHPVVAWTMFGATPFVLYFTGLYDATLRSSVVHEAVHLAFLAGGVAFFWPVVGIDPVPRRLHHAARLGVLFLAIPFHGFLGAALLWGADTSRRVGGGIIWVSGDVLAVVMLGVVLVQWMALESRRTV